jgi:hypothetical protein
MIQYLLNGGEKAINEHQKRRKKFQFSDNLGSMDIMETQKLLRV